MPRVRMEYKPERDVRGMLCDKWSPTGKPHKYTFIFLHDSGWPEIFAQDTIKGLSEERGSLHQELPGIKVIFPEASKASIERLPEDKFCGWFELSNSKRPHERQQEQDPQFTASVDYVVSVIHKEVELVGEEGIILGGQGHGCAVALHALLKSGRELGGFVGVSGWVPKPEEVAATSQDNWALNTPVCLTHSIDDRVIEVKYGEEMNHVLSTLGMDVCLTKSKGDDHGFTWRDLAIWWDEPRSGAAYILDFIAGAMIRADEWRGEEVEEVVETEEDRGMW